jgi:hypothetical protein
MHYEGREIAYGKHQKPSLRINFKGIDAVPSETEDKKRKKPMNR